MHFLYSGRKDFLLLLILDVPGYIGTHGDRDSVFSFSKRGEDGFAVSICVCEGQDVLWLSLVQI